ncbi:alpha-N-acetylglucosaminidase-like isoform X2 [Musa acuminata AAA Group]|uniref:alpha-N-acetylglucosaminidase-like isoform X2 n=1 Tax=Musa acuminata AAA Group TaxID=214697 RepID=UPI0031D556AF
MASPRPQPGIRPLFALFLSLFFLVFLLPWATGSSPLESSHLYRVLHIQERERLPPAVQVAAARGLLSRLLPFHVSSFEFEIVSKETCGGVACFIISNHPSLSTKGFPEILIQGTSGVELSAGLHWYLKHWCLIHISWEKTGGLQLSSLPKVGSLPHVPSAGILVQRPVPLSYYQNAVTSSYSYAWWSWERWEKEIDWMVLQGVNLPLAFNGQEAIWQKVFEVVFPVRPNPRLRR